MPSIIGGVEQLHRKAVESDTISQHASIGDQRIAAVSRPGSCDTVLEYLNVSDGKPRQSLAVTGIVIGGEGTIERIAGTRCGKTASFALAVMRNGHCLPPLYGN